MRIVFGLTVAACLVTAQSALAQPTDAPPPAAPLPPPVGQPPSAQPPVGLPQPQIVQPPPSTGGAPQPHQGPPIEGTIMPTHPHGMPHGEGHGHRDPHPWMHDRPRPWLGGLAWLSAGIMPGNFSGMQQTLGQTTVLGPGYDTAPMALVVGGGGGGLIGPLWVGGKGFALFDQTTPHGLADTSLTGAGGGFEIGYAAVATQDWLIVPYFGLGGFSYDLKVTAKQQPLNLYQGETVSVGAENSYTASLWTGELGLRVNRLILWDNAGMTVGGEIGYMSALTRDAWTGATTASPESAAISGGYFKIIVGGGGFMFKEHKHHD